MKNENFTMSDVKRYINGECLWNVDSLECNPRFMIEVLQKTKDIKIYQNQCKDIEKDYSFLYAVTKIFNSEEAAILIFKDVQKQVFDQDETGEILSYILLNYVNISKELTELLEGFMFNLFEVMQQYIDDSIKNMEKDFGYGFSLLSIGFADKPNYLKKYAMHYLDKYFSKEDLALKFYSSKYIHRKKVENKTTFIINEITKKDFSLANYVGVHLELLSTYINKIEKINNDYTFFERKLYDKVLNVIEDNINECYSLDLNTVLHYICEGSKLKVSDFYKYEDGFLYEKALVLDSSDFSEDYKTFIYENLSTYERLLLKRLKSEVLCKLGYKNIKEETTSKIIKFSNFD